MQLECERRLLQAASFYETELERVTLELNGSSEEKVAALYFANARAPRLPSHSKHDSKPTSVARLPPSFAQAAFEEERHKEARVELLRRQIGRRMLSRGVSLAWTSWTALCERRARAAAAKLLEIQMQRGDALENDRTSLRMELQSLLVEYASDCRSITIDGHFRHTFHHFRCPPYTTGTIGSWPRRWLPRRLLLRGCAQSSRARQVTTTDVEPLVTIEWPSDEALVTLW